MVEGGDSHHPKVSSSSSSSSSSGGGRGRGGGRGGGGRGRGGRGRSNNNNSSGRGGRGRGKRHNNNNGKNSTHHHHDDHDVSTTPKRNNKNNREEDKKGDGRTTTTASEGRGGSGGGGRGGRGRNNRGRGRGRGRGRSNGRKGNRGRGGGGGGRGAKTEEEEGTSSATQQHLDGGDEAPTISAPSPPLPSIFPGTTNKAKAAAAAAAGLPMILQRGMPLPTTLNVGHGEEDEDDDNGVGEGMGELHIAEQLAAAALEDFDDDDDDDAGVVKNDYPSTSVMNDSTRTATMTTMTTTPSTTTTSATTTQMSAETQSNSMTKEDISGYNNSKQQSTSSKPKKKKRKNKKESNGGETNTNGTSNVQTKNNGDTNAETTMITAAAAAAAAPPPTTTEALKALPAQAVSITATAVIKVRKSDSTTSLSKLADDASNSSTTPTTTTSSSKTTKSANNKKKKKKKGSLGPDDKANRKAALLFNRNARACVERSDPDALTELLHDDKNRHFALDAMTLEVVLKAYTMAAMLEDALYCLRHCTKPGTLSIHQTERIILCLPQNMRNASSFTAANVMDALCIATEFDSPRPRTYFLRIVRAMALEFLEEAMSARDRICSAHCEWLVRSAVCVVNARFHRGRKPSELVVQKGDQLGIFVRGGGGGDGTTNGNNNNADADQHRGIQAGDAVSILPYAGPYPMSAESLDRNMIEATVLYTSPHLVLRLQDKSNVNLYSMLTEQVEGNLYRIDKLANRMGFHRQLNAAVAMAAPIQPQQQGQQQQQQSKAVSSNRPSRELIQAVTAMDENINRVMLKGGGGGAAAATTASARNNTDGMTSTAELCSQPVPWSAQDEADLNPSGLVQDGARRGGTVRNRDDDERIRDASRLALDQYGALEGLNESQRLAVEGAVTNRLTLVQGPPGTGKTAVGIRILQHWARLATASASANNGGAGGGSGGPTSPILATSDSNIAVDNLVEGCANVGLRVVRLGRPEAIRPELLRFCIDRPPTSSSSQNSGNVNSYSSYGSGMTSASAYKEKVRQIKNAQVVCCTCIGSGGDILDSMTFERVLVDEATQATEPAVLVPLARGCRQLVLVGDHCQLPPTVLSPHAQEEGLGVPLFSRMVACGVPPFMLDTQYRMHPAIAMFPSDLFYGGKLKNGVSAPERRPLAGFPWPREEFPVAFVPVEGNEVDDGVSKLNEAEAAAACDAVGALLQGGQCKVSDIAVVTPYAAQARLIRRMTRKLTQNHGPPFVEVSSTDGFQGREKEAVVFSAVRCNTRGQVGFVSDWRRVNVSFTRARRALIVIGNEQTLRRGDAETWMPWLAWADAHGLNMDKPGIPRGRYEPEQLRRVRGGTTAAEMLKDVLARQQKQLESAEMQLEKAERKAAGHIFVVGKDGVDDDDDGGTANKLATTLEEDLAEMANEDGNWDDDDDDEIEVKAMRHSVSRSTLATASSAENNNALGGDHVDGSDDGPQDAWDL